MVSLARPQASAKKVKNGAPTWPREPEKKKIKEALARGVLDEGGIFWRSLICPDLCVQAAPF